MPKLNKKILIVAVVAIVIVAVATVLIVRQFQSAHVSSVAALENAVAPTPTPHVSFVLIKTAHGNRIAVSWSNLPEGTKMLEVFLALASNKATAGNSSGSGPAWSLWRTINLSPDELTNGSREIDVGTSTFAGDSFYAQAIGNDNGGNGSSSSEPGGPSTGPDTILWTSSSTFSTEETSTIPLGPPPQNGSNPTSTGTQTPTSTQSSTLPEAPDETPTSTPTDTTPLPPPPSPQPLPTSTGGNNPGGGGQTPTGIPYYNTHNQLTGYGPYQTGSFWVQNINQRIEIGWQNLPAGLTNLVVSRSSSENGPWLELMTQSNPEPSSTYTLQVVDSSVNTSQYYLMTTFDGSTTVGTYGPEYLAPSQ